MLKLENEKDKIIDRYLNGEGLKTIAKTYKCDKKTVRAILLKNNIKIRERNHVPYDNFNENYFDEIDTQNKAYILGFLYADGCNTKGNKIKLSLQDTDVEILEKIRQEMKIEKPLSFYNRNDKNPKHHNVYELVIYNKHMSEQLSKLGCVPKKSLILKFPDFIKPELMSHFIRGYFDGDGHIGKNGRGMHASFVSSTLFCEKLSEFLTSELEIENHLNIFKENNRTARVTITKKEETRKLMEYLYKDAELFLKRKHDIYLSKIEKEVIN